MVISDEILARARGNDVSGEILAVFGDWAVTDYGVESLGPFYPIHRSRLCEDWDSHMDGKDWVEMEDFRAALSFGRENAGELKG